MRDKKVFESICENLLFLIFNSYRCCGFFVFFNIRINYSEEFYYELKIFKKQLIVKPGDNEVLIYDLLCAFALFGLAIEGGSQKCQLIPQSQVLWTDHPKSLPNMAFPDEDRVRYVNWINLSHVLKNSQPTIAIVEAETV